MNRRGFFKGVAAAVGAVAGVGVARKAVALPWWLRRYELGDSVVFDNVKVLPPPRVAPHGFYVACRDDGKTSEKEMIKRAFAKIEAEHGLATAQSLRVVSKKRSYGAKGVFRFVLTNYPPFSRVSIPDFTEVL